MSTRGLCFFWTTQENNSPACFQQTTVDCPQIVTLTRINIRFLDFYAFCCCFCRVWYVVYDETFYDRSNCPGPYKLGFINYTQEGKNDTFQGLLAKINGDMFKKTVSGSASFCVSFPLCTLRKLDNHWCITFDFCVFSSAIFSGLLNTEGIHNICYASTGSLNHSAVQYWYYANYR